MIRGAITGAAIAATLIFAAPHVGLLCASVAAGSIGSLLDYVLEGIQALIMGNPFEWSAEKALQALIIGGLAGAISFGVGHLVRGLLTKLLGPTFRYVFEIILIRRQTIIMFFIQTERAFLFGLISVTQNSLIVTVIVTELLSRAVINLMDSPIQRVRTPFNRQYQEQ